MPDIETQKAHQSEKVLCSRIGSKLYLTLECFFEISRILLRQQRPQKKDFVKIFKKHSAADLISFKIIS